MAPLRVYGVIPAAAATSFAQNAIIFCHTGETTAALGLRPTWVCFLCRRQCHRDVEPSERLTPMDIDEIRRTARAMPLTNPSYPPPPYRFYDREYIIITYRTDRDALRRAVPEPLELPENDSLVHFEFIRMPDSTGFG